MMVTLDRWQAAQEYERGYWQSFGEQIATGQVDQMDWYAWRAEQLQGLLQRVGRPHLTDGRAAVVEVGCGPIGVASFFPARRRVAIDPLEPFYASNPVLTKLRNPAVEYMQGTGESLPVDAGAFDLAIIENCIDHVRDVDSVMRELRRVMQPDGVLYLTVNCRTSIGYMVHRALSRLRIDAGHPHTFTPDRVAAMFARNGFRILDLQAASVLEAFKEDLLADSLRPKVKALLGTSEFVTTAVATPLR